MTVSPWQHPACSRRTAIQVGAAGILGLGSNHLSALRAANASPETPATAKSCIYIFLSGGLAQQDSFDLKPHAPDTVRGEFLPIATRTPGIEICEHLPMFAQRSEHWALVRSSSHPSNEHTVSHYYMLTGRTDLTGFRGDRKPRPTDWPSIASIVGDAVPPQNNNLPPAVMLPERLVHWSGGTIPGAYGGQMGHQRDPFIIEATHYGDPFWRGAYPEYTFHQLPKTKATSEPPKLFQAPNLKVPTDLAGQRFDSRMRLLETVEVQVNELDLPAAVSAGPC